MSTQYNIYTHRGFNKFRKLVNTVLLPFCQEEFKLEL